MVMQDTVTELSQKFALTDEHMELLNTTFDNEFESVFQKYDSDGNGMVSQDAFYDFFTDIITEYNKQLDKQVVVEPTKEDDIDGLLSDEETETKDNK